jgi:hypothetical protein
LSVNKLTRILEEFWSLETDTRKYANLTRLYHERGYMALVKMEILVVMSGNESVSVPLQVFAFEK